jgi:hypothetical protein
MLSFSSLDLTLSRTPSDGLAHSLIILPRGEKPRRDGRIDAERPDRQPMRHSATEQSASQGINIFGSESDKAIRRGVVDFVAVKAQAIHED